MRISDMSLREKVLQTVVIRVNKDAMVRENVGGAFFFGEIITEADEMGLNGARNLLKEYIDNAKIPVLITSDFENGCGSMLKGLTPLPYLMSLGATNSEKLAYDYGKATALEARSMGANWSFSPVSDLNINKRNPIINVRGISDDPALASRLLKQVVKGMQENGLAACAKHFPGDGIDWRDQHLVTTNNTLSFEEWKKLSGKVFEELISADVYSIMAGHITLPEYQKEVFHNGLKLPATLSRELIQNLLKSEMGFNGVVVTDALDMGGFLGWYPSKERSEIEAIRAGCDMVLWPTKNYVDNMVQAVENKYISEERLDDAVSRILQMKEKLGLFRQDNHAVLLSEEDRNYVSRVQREVAEKSVTIIKDQLPVFPLETNQYKNIAVVPITHYEPSLEEAERLCQEIRKRGVNATCYYNGIDEEAIESQDLVIYALFSRPFRPIGFLDFHSEEARKVQKSLQTGVEKSVVVSFGSPYFGGQYFERAMAYVNAYSMLQPSVEAFVRAAFGEIPFHTFSPVDL